MKFLPRVHGWPKAIEPLALFAKDQPLKAHTAYVRAKAGDEAAALDLLLDLAVAWLYQQRARFAPRLWYVAPHTAAHMAAKVCGMALSPVAS